MIILFVEKKGAAEKKKVALIGKSASEANDVVNSSELLETRPRVKETSMQKRETRISWEHFFG